MRKELQYSVLGLAVLLLMSLLPMPYGFYVLIRFLAMVVFACLAYHFHETENMVLCVVTGALALLFQPFFKIVLGREVWQMVDVVVAVALLYYWYKTKK
jgi:hypothetical protein